MTTVTEPTLLDKFVQITTRKRDLESEVNLLKKQLAPLEAQLLDEYAQEGVRSKATTDGATVYLNRKIWARAGDGGKPAACIALRNAGLGAFIEEGFNTNSLSAHFRELAKTREAEGAPLTDVADLLPEELRGAIHLTEDHKLGLTRS